MLLKSTLLCVMRHPGSSYPRIPSSTVTLAQDTDWHTLKRLFPYLWEYKWRVMAALTFMVGAKVANVGVPLLLKELIDSMTPQPTVAQAVLVVPIALLVAYGLLRLSVSAFTELRELVFAEATQGAAKRIALETFEHLHRLSLRFHLERQTGGMSRDIERGVRGIESLIAYSLYSIVPTLIEVVLVLTILGLKFDKWYAIITLIALAAYIYFTVTITEWRTQFRKQVNEFDSNAHSRAIDSLLNYETVKYFGNEAFEAKSYDDNLDKLRKARIKAQNSLSALNIGQQLIIAVALVGMLWRATQGVVDGRMTLGDLVMINAFMIQLYIPLNFLGVIYREIKQSLTDLERMFELLEKQREVADLPSAQALQLTQPPEVRFENVFFAYEPDRPILHGISLTIPAGKTVAVVGPSGSGKSTLARLLFRFYDAQDGSIRIDGQDIKHLTQDSVRRAIGIVPQDTVLFNDTVYYNIAYGQTAASKDQVEEAAKSARIHDFIASTPQGYETMVGERGLKLSGGEKQRVAIARSLANRPKVLIADEPTGNLDPNTSRVVFQNLFEIAKQEGVAVLVATHNVELTSVMDRVLTLHDGRLEPAPARAD